MSDIEPIEIPRVVMDDPDLSEVEKPFANDLNVHRRILYHMVCNIILPKIEKFEYVTFLDLFMMFCLITRHLMNHMRAAYEKKRQGFPYGMLFAHIFDLYDVDTNREVRKNPKVSREYNQKTLRLVGFVQIEDDQWVKKAVAIPSQEIQGKEAEDEDANEEDPEEVEAVAED
ncbi:hypothetical protein CJ030_MR4G013690 [Morella rubra]|uniref:Uncharacterized protein n=1 Tax=Morella rubra TaxID=262757 RepID=A0A6A1WWN6_9ROSI|nr:hypothetical protein CJ030_MR5G024771 [Morella rubra]KAB1228088.1 hypothetical protein CJ030_MR4G013690 [Morella rubra]